MILNTWGKFQSNTRDSHLENNHLHVNLNVCFLSSKGAITHPFINSELLFLQCLIGLMILYTCWKFRSSTRNGYLEKLESIHLHANQTPKGPILIYKSIQSCLFLLCLKGLMIRNACGKFQSNICSCHLENLKYPLACKP